MRRRECGIVRDGGAPTTAPRRRPEPVGPCGAALSEARRRRKKPAGWCGGRFAGLTQPARTAAQAAVFPAAMSRQPLRTGRRGFTSADLMAPAYWPRSPAPPTAVGKKLSPQRGGRRASLKHRARNAEVSAESRSTSSTSLGVARLRGTRVRFAYADNETRRSARPLLSRRPAKQTTTPPRRKEQGMRSYAKSAFTRVFRMKATRAV
jgi:hypothetical protein